MCILAEAAPNIFQLLSEKEDLLPGIRIVDPLDQRLLLLVRTVRASQQVAGAATVMISGGFWKRVAAGERAARHGGRAAACASMGDAAVIAAQRPTNPLLGKTRAGQLHVAGLGRDRLPLRLRELEGQQLLLLLLQLLLLLLQLLLLLVVMIADGQILQRTGNAGPETAAAAAACALLLLTLAATGEGELRQLGGNLLLHLQHLPLRLIRSREQVLILTPHQITRLFHRRIAVVHGGGQGGQLAVRGGQAGGGKRGCRGGGFSRCVAAGRRHRLAHLHDEALWLGRMRGRAYHSHVGSNVDALGGERLQLPVELVPLLLHILLLLLQGSLQYIAIY
jgi:hypothetical protein